MYAGLWRILPGPWPVKLIIVLALIAAALYGLFWYAFPWVAGMIIPDEATVGMALVVGVPPA